MIRSFFILLSLISSLFGGEIILSPYQATGHVDSVDENSSAGTIICRITLDGNSLVDPSNSVTLNKTSEFSLAQIDSQIWIVTSRVLDYDDVTEFTSFPLLITATTPTGTFTKNNTMGVRPKNDNDFRGSGFVLNLRENDIAHFSLAVLADSLSKKHEIIPPLFTDDDLEKQNNRWSVTAISNPFHGTLDRDSAELGIFTYDHDDKGNEFLADSFSYFILDSTTYDVTTREIGPFWAIFKLRNVNDEPVFAIPDTLIVVEGSTIAMTLQGNRSLCQNDLDEDNAYDRNGDGIIDIDFPLSARLISPAKGVSGTISIKGDGSFSYVHTGSGSPEKFLVEISDGIFKDTSEVIVLVTLLNNHTPTFTPETLTVNQGSTTSSFASGTTSLLKFAADGDLPDDTLSIVPFQGKTITGTVAIFSNGTFSYTHNGSRNFVDSIPVSVKDASGKWVNSFVPVKISVAALPLFSIEIKPLTGAIPTQTKIVSSMTDPVNPKPSLATGTVCDIQMSRRVELSDLTVTATLYDVVGNKLLTSEYTGTNRSGFLITRHEKGDMVRLFWDGRNEMGRVVGGGTYLLSIEIRDGFNGEKVSGTALWGTPRPPIAGLDF